MSDFTISKHINGRDWHGNVEVATPAYNALGNWTTTSSTKKTVKKKTLGAAQKAANKTGQRMTVDEYTGKGDLKKKHKVSPK